MALINKTESTIFIKNKRIQVIDFLRGIAVFLMVFYHCLYISRLYGILKFKPNRKYVVVDMGAVEFITSGADLMAPGIIDADNTIQENDHVWICDEQHHKPIATGIALMNGNDMIIEKKGKSVKVIHYVGDKYWNINK